MPPKTPVPPPPAVSVVMTTFNCETHVRDAVASILAQSLADFEFIIVDDGSTDGTLAAIQSFNDARIRLLQIPRCGRIPSLNHAFRKARADLIANQDADDVSSPDRLQVSVAAMHEHPAWAMLGAAVVPLIDEKGDVLGERRRATDPRQLRHDLGTSMPFFHSSCTYRKSAWAEAGGFDERLPMFEDYDLWVRLTARHPIANLPQALGQKRRHPHQAFDARHWTNQGYRTRSKILWRYVRKVSPNPLVLLRAGVFLVMTPRLRLLWMKTTRRGKLEFRVRERMNG